MLQRKLLVTGTCRSGTWYLTKCLLTAGLDIGHEAIKGDGTVSGFMWLNHDWYPSKHERPGDPAPCFVDYAHRWHVVREPLTTIPSLAYVLDNDRMQRWVDDLTLAGVLSPLGSFRPVPEPWPSPAALRAALRYWVVAQEHAIEMTDWRFRIEDLPQEWPVFEQALGVGPYPDDVEIPNYKGRGQTSWGELFDLDRDYAHRALKLAIAFGYWQEAA
jgi:hypothetical protein